MAAQQRDSLRADLRTEIKTDPNGKIWKNDELNNLLEQAYYKIQSDVEFRFAENEADETTFSTVSGTATYALPTNFGRMEVVRYDNRMLTRTTLQKIKRNTTTTDNGTPNSYYIRGTKIGLWPTPNEAKTVAELFVSALPFVTDDSTAIDYDDNEIVRALIKCGAYLAWSSPRGNKATALEKLDDYNEVMKSIKIRRIYRDRNFDYRTVREPASGFNTRALGNRYFR